MIKKLYKKEKKTNKYRHTQSIIYNDGIWFDEFDF